MVWNLTTCGSCLINFYKNYDDSRDDVSCGKMFLEPGSFMAFTSNYYTDMLHGINETKYDAIDKTLLNYE